MSISQIPSVLDVAQHIADMEAEDWAIAHEAAGAIQELKCTMHPLDFGELIVEATQTMVRLGIDARTGSQVPVTTS